MNSGHQGIYSTSENVNEILHEQLLRAIITVPLWRSCRLANNCSSVSMETY